MNHYISHQSDIFSLLMVGLHWLMVRSVEASAARAWVVRNVAEVWGRPLSVIYFLSSVYHSPLTVSVLIPVCLYVLRLGQRIREERWNAKLKLHWLPQFVPPNHPADDLPTLLLLLHCCSYCCSDHIGVLCSLYTVILYLRKWKREKILYQ